MSSLRRHSAPEFKLPISEKRTNSISTKYKHRKSITSPKRFIGGKFKMVDLKTYAKDYYKGNVLEYNRFVNYIIDNISIFCNRGIQEGYIKFYMLQYFKEKGNFSVWVLVNINKKLNIDLKDQIKAFAIVENHLVHRNTKYGMLKYIEGKWDNGYNFFHEKSSGNKALLWAELLAICGVVPRLMPKMNVDTKLLTKVQRTWDPRTWRESDRAQKTKKKRKTVHKKNIKTEKQKGKILKMNQLGDTLFKGIGNKLLSQLIEHYKSEDNDGIKYSFIYLEAIMESEFEIPKGLIKFYKKNGFKHVAHSETALIKDFDEFTKKHLIEGDFIKLKKEIKLSTSEEENKENHFYLPMIYELNRGAEFDAKYKISNSIEDTPLNKFN
jgi:hypothetical protein